jgi:hypothetical protein
MAADWIIFRGSDKTDRYHPFFDVKSRGMFFFVFHRFLFRRFEDDPVLSRDNVLQYRIHRSYHSSLEHLSLEGCSDLSLRAIARNLIQACREDHPFWIDWLNPLPDQWESGPFLFSERPNIAKEIQRFHEVELADWRRCRAKASEEEIQRLGRGYMKKYFLQVAGAALAELEKRQMERDELSSKERIMVLLKGIILGRLADQWVQEKTASQKWLPARIWLRKKYPGLDYGDELESWGL